MASRVGSEEHSHWEITSEPSGNLLKLPIFSWLKCIVVGKVLFENQCANVSMESHKEVALAFIAPFSRNSPEFPFGKSLFLIVWLCVHGGALSPVPGIKYVTQT